ncbi:MAG: hypothetical protein IPL71_24805 [Anaerolineales bacterium]|uniref:hypothetical protein n=1 Tax=Candidatus Villigracilis proximus TaxID=3140683 RepID=UPI0031356B77|nr:hypothetical protein [Anaerolineales bacterium]
MPNQTHITHFYIGYAQGNTILGEVLARLWWNSRAMNDPRLVPRNLGLGVITVMWIYEKPQRQEPQVYMSAVNGWRNFMGSHGLALERRITKLLKKPHSAKPTMPNGARCIANGMLAMNTCGITRHETREGV